jgi:hypothetical protein
MNRASTRLIQHFPVYRLRTDTGRVGEFAYLLQTLVMALPREFQFADSLGSYAQQMRYRVQTENQILLVPWLGPA